jgi:hypothetical protein
MISSLAGVPLSLVGDASRIGGTSLIDRMNREPPQVDLAALEAADAQNPGQDARRKFMIDGMKKCGKRGCPDQVRH